MELGGRLSSLGGPPCRTEHEGIESDINGREREGIEASGRSHRGIARDELAVRPKRASNVAALTLAGLAVGACLLLSSHK